jgi:DNA-binding transcriptional LysR family regulator
MRSNPIGDNASTSGFICYKIVLMADPVETSELLAFTKTVDAKSLTRAARELGVPRATVSRRLRRLETRLGTRLIRRTTRSLTLTDAGNAFYRHARIVLDAVANAEASVRRTDNAIRGDLRVSVPPLLDESLFQVLSSFALKHPHVRMQVHSSTRHVDLQGDGYDVALRAGSAIEPGLIARTVFRSETVAVASPSYLAAHGTPRAARDLRKHRCLMGFARGELPETHWPIGGRRVHVEGAFFSNAIGLLCSAAIRGLGIALLPELFVLEHIKAGALVRVLEGVVHGGDRIAIVYPERELVAPQVRAFIEAISSWAPRTLADRPPAKAAASKRK